MASRRPGPGELLAGISGGLLLLAMFLPWFGLNGRARVPGTGEVISVGRDNLSAWEAFGFIDIVLALTAGLAIAVLVVAFMSRPPPALVLVATGAAALAAVLIVYRLIDVPEIAVNDPGDTAYETGRRLGIFFGLLFTAGIAWGMGRAGAEAVAPARAPAPKPAPTPAPARPARRRPKPAPASPTPTPASASATPASASRGPATAPAAAPPARPSRRPPRRPKTAPVKPAPASSPLAGWTRATIDAECQVAWRRHDRRLGARYARYFEDHPELAGEQRTSARDLAAALPPAWKAPAGAIPDRPWQRHHLSAKSSQMLGVGLLGVAAARDPSLAWLWDALAPLPPAAADVPSIEFAHVVDPTLLGERPRQTSFDVLIDDPAVLIGIETKWREHGIGTCLCRGEGAGPLEGEHCSRRVEQRHAYWETAADVLGLGAREPGATCPISPVYELVRHAAALRALAGERPTVLALLYDADNPYFAPTGDWPGWPALLEQAVEASESFRFAAISWQQLTPMLPLDEPARAWAAEKHALH